MRISASRINTYLSCRRKYEISYIHNLAPLRDPKPLVDGKAYHALIENLLKGKDIDHTPETMAFEKKSGYKNWDIKGIEEEFLDRRNGYDLHGFIDVVCGDCIIDHKTTSSAIDEKFISKLRLDRQFKIYCFIKNVTKAKIAVVKKCALKQGKNESDEEYFNRRCDWYDGDTKFQVIDIEYTREEIRDCMNEVDGVAREMKACDFYPRNPASCKIMGCPFLDICMSKDMGNVIGFKKKELRQKVAF